jgi:hypothetical protein
MRRSTPLLVLAALLAGAAGAQEAANPYQTPLKPSGFEARAVAVPPLALPGELAPEAAAHLGVEIRVQVTDYLPRALEPTLVIDGEPIEARTRIVAVEGDVTTLGFLVDTPEHLKDGASLAVQMGEDETTRASLPTVLRLEEIRPLDPAEAKKHGLPDLKSWLSPPDAPP